MFFYPTGVANDHQKVRKLVVGVEPHEHVSGQISSRPHTTDFPQMVGLVREMGPPISGKSRLVKYYSIWPDV